MSTLFKFTVGSSTYCYTSLQKDVTVDSVLYSAKAIQRSEMVMENINNNFTISMPPDLAPADSLLSDSLTDGIQVELFNVDNTPKKLFKGRVVDFQYGLARGELKLKCESFPEKNSSVLKRLIGNSCQWGLYRGFEDASPSASSATTVESPTPADQSYIIFTGGSLPSDGQMISVDGRPYKISSTETDGLNKKYNLDTDYSSSFEIPNGTAWYPIDTEVQSCPVNKASFSATETGIVLGDWSGGGKQLDNISTVALLATDSGTGYFSYKWGIVYFKDSGGNIIEKGYVTDVSSSSTYIRFHKRVRNTTTITSAVFYQGCSKQYETCRDKFNAQGYYGGYPSVNRGDRFPWSDKLLGDHLKSGKQELPEVFGTVWTENASVIWTDPIPYQKKRREAGMGHAVFGGMALGLARRLDKVLKFKWGSERPEPFRLYDPTGGGMSGTIPQLEYARPPLKDGEEAALYMPRSLYPIFNIFRQSDGIWAGQGPHKGISRKFILGTDFWTTINKNGAYQRLAFYDGKSNTEVDSYLKDRESKLGTPAQDTIFFKDSAYVVLKEIYVRDLYNYLDHIFPGAFWGAHDFWNGQEDFAGGVSKELQFLCQHIPVINESSHEEDSIYVPGDTYSCLATVASGNTTITIINTLHRLGVDSDPYEAGDRLSIAKWVSHDNEHKEEIYKIISVTDDTHLVVSPAPDFTGTVQFNDALPYLANPANVIYYVLTEILKIDSSDVDIPSFTTARGTLHTENIGINKVLSSQGKAVSFIGSVLDLIKGILTFDFTTSKWTLELLRKADASQRTYGDLGTAGASDFSIVNDSWEKLYNKVLVDYKTYTGEGTLTLTNEVAREFLDTDRLSKVSVPFTTSDEGVSFYASNKLSELSKLKHRVTFRVDSKELFTASYPLKVGKIISYYSDHFPLAALDLRVLRISGYNETNATVKINAISDLSEDDSFAPNPSPGYQGGLSLGEVDTVSIFPVFRDIGTSNKGASTAFVLSNGCLSEKQASEVELAFDNENGVQVDSIEVAAIPVGLLADGTYDPTGHLDFSSTGMTLDVHEIFDIPDKDISLNGLFNTGTVSHAIIERKVDSGYDSDYEMIVFGKIEKITGASSPYQRYRITNIVRNVAHPVQYVVPTGGNSGWVDGHTNITGQYRHYSGDKVWLFLNGHPRGHVFDVPVFSINSNASYRYSAFARALNSITSGQWDSSANDFDHTEPHSQATSANTVDFPAVTPFPPASILAYRFKDSSEYYYVLYIARAPLSSQDSYLASYDHTAADFASLAPAPNSGDIYIEPSSSEGNDPKILIRDKEDFDDDYNTSFSDYGDHWKGHLRDNKMDYEIITGDNFIATATQGQGEVLFDNKRVVDGHLCGLNYDVTYHACLVYYGNTVSEVTFKVVHQEDGLSRSQAKTFTLNDTTQEVRI